MSAAFGLRDPIYQSPFLVTETLVSLEPRVKLAQVPVKYHPDSDPPLRTTVTPLSTTLCNYCSKMPVKRACDVCFRRKVTFPYRFINSQSLLTVKIQCIKPDPNLPCEWCADHNLDCAVTRESQRKRPDDL